MHGLACDLPPQVFFRRKCVKSPLFFQVLLVYFEVVAFVIVGILYPAATLFFSRTFIIVSLSCVEKGETEDESTHFSVFWDT